MRTGSGQRPPGGRYNGNRPFGQPRHSPQRGQTFDSNGPDIKIRGSAHQIFERYIALAREASIEGDTIAAENLYQHAEHYFRIANANRDVSQPGMSPQPITPADTARDGAEERSNEDDLKPPRRGWGDDRPGFE